MEIAQDSSLFLMSDLPYSQNTMTDEQLRETLARQLRRFREAAGMSQADLGRAAHVDDSAISRIEGKSRLPALDTLVRIAEALSVPISALLGETQSLPDLRRVLRDPDAEVTYRGRRLTDEEKEHLLTLIDAALALRDVKPTEESAAQERPRIRDFEWQMALELARFIKNTKLSVDATAREFGIERDDVVHAIYEVLPAIHPGMYQEVKAILDHKIDPSSDEDLAEQRVVNAAPYPRAAHSPDPGTYVEGDPRMDKYLRDLEKRIRAGIAERKRREKGEG
ncbi:MAG: helix-turn-helix domain-containing protein [Firmicutes bacterium]|nr:helix-turn-helix domain-containing protein [Bacillota bacterium]MBE3590867.1 helix-turn-helix domain-containing protein [Bacillota bacterium]